MNNLRNIAIIAHVDHGKTTLVDAMLRQSGAFHEHQELQDRAMDSNELERERGITILAKCTSFIWNETRLNIVDTPGHADFGGEVERILGMVDGVLILVDAAEGPMPQTKFVLAKALSLGLKPIVVINKADRPDARPSQVLDEIFDLFVALEANEEQLDFSCIYASAREGWAIKNLNDEKKDLSCLFEIVIDHVSAPDVDYQAPFSMNVSLLESDPYLGRVLTGRIETGSVRMNQQVKVLNSNGQVVEQGRLTKLLAYRFLSRSPVEEAQAGDIIAIAGLSEATVPNTICDLEVTQPLPSLPIDPPTLVMRFAVNDSPLAGQDGDKVTSRVIRDRLLKEQEGNVALKIEESEDKDAFEVAGRGELQLAVLIETMRREGFELSVSRPRVLLRKDSKGETEEPMEEVQVDVDDDFTGVVIEKMGLRKGELIDMKPSGGGKTRVTFLSPSRGLIGYHGEFLADTRGTGIMSRIFHGYAPYKGNIEGRSTGVLISNGKGQAVAYALWNLEERGIMFVEPGTQVYQGMIIGENSRNNDLEVNPLKAKQLTNIRASGKDESIRLTPARLMTLEQALAYIQDDELVEVTPNYIRLRKRFLDPNVRKRAQREKI